MAGIWCNVKKSWGTTRRQGTKFNSVEETQAGLDQVRGGLEIQKARGGFQRLRRGIRGNIKKD